MSVHLPLFPLRFEFLDDFSEHTWMKSFLLPLFLLLVLHWFLLQYHCDFTWENKTHLLHCYNLMFLTILDFCMLHQLQHQYFQQFPQVFYYNIYILYFKKSNQEEYLHILRDQTYHVFHQSF